MKHMADTVKKNLYRGVSGLLAAAVLLSGSGWVREVQARRRSVDDPTIRITFSEGEQPSALRYQAALAVHQQAEEEYEEALEAATLAAERLAAEKAAEELKNNVSNLETPENTGDSVGIQGGSGSGKNPSLNLQGGGLLDYEDRYVNLFEEETADPETTEPVTSKRTSRLLAYGEELIAIEGVLDRHGEVDEEVLIEVLGLEEALQEPVDSYSDTTGLVFDEVSTTAEPDISGCVSLPGPTFADTVSVKWNANDANYVDCETFFFDDLGADDEIPETSWSYTFTGWHIVNAGDAYIPAETVFQPGDTVTPDVLEQYVSGGSLELEALWGKCYYIRNPYKTMVYTQLTPPNGLSYEFDADASSNPTGASDLNDGRTVDTAKATIDGLYRDFRANITAGTQDQGNAYETVVMLTGDLNYYKFNDEAGKIDYSNVYGRDATDESGSSFVSATYKSLQTTKGQRYVYYYRPQGYANNLYGNLRLDNIDFRTPAAKVHTQSSSTEFVVLEKGKPQNTTSYFETTVRFVQNSESEVSRPAIATFRPNTQDVVVLNGGAFNSMQNSYSSAISGETFRWYVGRKASIGDLHCGVTSKYASNTAVLKCDYVLTVTGGSIDSIFGGSNGIYSKCIGDRTFRIYGNEAAAQGERNPKIKNIYGGAAQCALDGDIRLDIYNCKTIENVYGGGRDYTATTTGNITVNLINSTLSGDLFGGGYNGNLVGDVTINISQNSQVCGNVYGSGTGSTQTITVPIGRTISSRANDPNAWWIQNTYVDGWFIAPSGYPTYRPDTGYFLTGVLRRLTWTSLGNANNQLTFYDDEYLTYLSTATVQNVNIRISDSEIGKAQGSKGNVYGGGSLAKVLGNIDIQITNTTIHGNVYGGGDGVTEAQPVQLYDPLTTYTAPSYSATYEPGSVPTSVKLIDQRPKYNDNSVLKGTYRWSSDPAVLEMGGIDHNKKLLYSKNSDDHGAVQGNITVTINSGTFHGDVYGGGNKGKTFGNITLNINGGTFEKTVYGGANQADVNGIVTLNVHGGTYEKDLYGANNQAGQIGGPVNVTLNGGEVNGSLFGGGNLANGEYTVNLTVNDGTIGTADASGNIFGGGNEANVGATVVAMNGGTVTGSVFGGNNLKGEVKTSTSVALAGGSVAGNIYGGGNQAGNPSENQQFDTVVSISGGSIGTDDDTATGHVYGGGLGTTATVGNTQVTISGGSVADVYGGGDAGQQHAGHCGCRQNGKRYGLWRRQSGQCQWPDCCFGSRYRERKRLWRRQYGRRSGRQCTK